MTRIVIGLIVVLGYGGLPAQAQNLAFPADAIVRELEATARECPRAWSHAHDGGPEEYDFIIEAVKRLYTASNGTVGGNWRRARINDLSRDGISVLGSDGRYYFLDIIVNAGSANPSLPSARDLRIGPENLLRDPAGNYAPQGFAHAHQLQAPAVPCTVETPPSPPPPSVPPPTDVQAVLDQLAHLDEKLSELTQRLEEMRPRVESASHESLQAALRAIEIKDALAVQGHMLMEIMARPGQACEPVEYVFDLFGRPVVLRPRR